MKRKVDIHLHHNLKSQINISESAGFRSVLKKGLGFVFEVSYTIGMILISVFRSPKSFVQKIQNARLNREVTKSLASFLLVLLLVLSPLGLLLVISDGQKLSGKILGSTNDVGTNLSKTQESLKKQDYQAAGQSLEQVLGNLSSMERQLGDTSLVLQSVIKYAPAEFNTQNLLESAKLLAEAGQDATQILYIVQNLKVGPQGLSGSLDQSSLEILTLFEQRSQSLSYKFNQANSLLAPINSSFLPAELQNSLITAQELVADLSEQVEQLSQVAKLTKGVFATNQSFLILLQNNNELRPTGGFIGTVAQGQFKSGQISELDIRSVYDLDGQLLENITPPEPLMNVSNRLFLRDSNWFADFRETAQLISTMYEKEGGETPGIIIALTPDMFISFLEATGPITLPNYNLTVTSKNFIETIQTTTSVAYNKDLNQPKQLLADLYPILMQKLSSLSESQPLWLVNAMLQNMSQNNIVIYSKNAELQSIIERFDWGGALAKTDGDYLMINQANLSGSKTDRFMERSVELNSTINEDGTIINEVKLTLKNNLPADPKLENLSWVRFIVPKNSRLISAGGFTDHEIKLDDQISSIEDSTIANWQNSTSYDFTQKVLIGSEGNYSFFGAWLKVAGGESKTASITYQLPFRIDKQLDTYSLIWQKQIGMMPVIIKHHVHFPERNLIWDNLYNKDFRIDRSQQNSLLTENILAGDYFLGLVFNN